MSELELFSKFLIQEADELDAYARNIIRANGGDEDEQTKHYELKASILQEVAKAASKAVDVVRQNAARVRNNS